MKKISVIGAGQMGMGIAQVGAQAGFDIVLYDINEEMLDKAKTGIIKNINKGIERGKFNAGVKEAALSHLVTTTSINDIADSELVIESVPEIVKLKLEIYQKICEVCSPDVFIATNTSSQSITELASGVRRPERFVGMHFFNPVHLMKLVEIIRGMETSDETVAVIKKVAEDMGKEVVEVNEAPGFVTSRMNALIGNEAFRMLEEGVASARDIDKAIKLGLNHPMGPFEMIDLVGLDTRLRTMEYLHATLGENFRPSVLHRKYVLAGRLGKKVGKGVYEY